MKTIFLRITIVFFSFIIAYLFFGFIVLGAGFLEMPIRRGLTTLKSTFSFFEKKIFDPNKNRLYSLDWINNKSDIVEFLKRPDTILFGVFDDSYHVGFGKVEKIEKELGTTFPLIQVFSAWGSRYDQNFPLTAMRSLVDYGSIPMLTWEPWLDDFSPKKFKELQGKEDFNKNGLSLIYQGVFDTYIERWIERAKLLDSPFFLRFGHEMNDPYRYPWGPHNNKPEDYVKAWRHIYNKFQEAELYNVIWVWSPHPAYLDFEEFYPGDEYVDWISFTALNYGAVVTWSRWWGLDDLIKEAYDELAFCDKPIMLSEFGSLPIGGNRAQWYEQGLHSIHNKFDRIKSVFFFNSKEIYNTTNRTFFWHIHDDKDVLNAIRENLTPKQDIIEEPDAKSDSFISEQAPPI